MLNRHEFERRLSRVLMSADRADPYALLNLDLDQLKGVNDTGGHATGDEALRGLSALLHDRVQKKTCPAGASLDPYTNDCVAGAQGSVSRTKDLATTARHSIIPGIARMHVPWMLEPE